MDYNKKWIKEGTQVAHRDNIQQKIWVEKLYYKSKTMQEGSIKRNVNILIGVLCHWFDNTGNFNRSQFHSHELIPWDIAKKGEGSVNEWINMKKVE